MGAGESSHLAPANSSTPSETQNAQFHRASCSKFIPADAKPPPVDKLPLLRATITAQGEIRDAQILRSTGDTRFDAAIISCANGNYFPPLKVNGTATDVRWVLGFKMLPSDSGFIPGRSDPGYGCYNKLGPTAIRKPLSDIKITYRIGHDGLPTGLMIAQSSGSQELDQVTADCVAGVHYFPATTPSGQPVEPDGEYVTKLRLGPPA